MTNHFNNGAWRTAAFLCLLLAVLVGLSFVPAFSIGSYEVKRVNLLSDVLGEDATAASEMLAQAAAAKEKAAFRDSCPPGLTCIDDFDADRQHGMWAFYEALANRETLGRPVRIAYFGDSFIEGDILTQDLREMLQSHFGGCGVGMVDVASPFTELRATVRHDVSGFTDHNVLEKQGADTERLGITCRYALGTAGSQVTFAGTSYKQHLDTFNVATLYLRAAAPIAVGIAKNGGTAMRYDAQGNGRVEAVKAEGRMGRVTFKLGGAATAFGVALEGRNGISLDNFSLRGSSGAPLAKIPEAHLKQLHDVRPYDLIVLQFGLNVASKKVTDYAYYVNQMKPVVERFKAAFPEASILVVSIGDREDKVNGQIATMPGVVALADYQLSLAAEEGVAFWNLFKGMGGEGSIKAMAETKPAEARTDYTHINARGGKRIAAQLFKTLVWGFDEHERRKAFEAENGQ